MSPKLQLDRERSYIYNNNRNSNGVVMCAMILFNINKKYILVDKNYQLGIKCQICLSIIYVLLICFLFLLFLGSFEKINVVFVKAKV